MKRFVEFYGTDPQGYGYEVVSEDGDNVTARALPEGDANSNFVFTRAEFASGYLVPPCSCGSTRLRRIVDAATNETYCEECGDVQV